jgi:hypothetical protein
LVVASCFDGILVLAVGEDAFFTVGDLGFPDSEAMASAFFDGCFFAADVWI